MPFPLNRLSLPLFAVLAAAGLAACGTSSTSTSGFTGEKHAVAEAISNLQSDVTSGNQKKICENDLSAAVVAGLRSASSSTGTYAGCEHSIKEQVQEIDNLDLAIDTVTLTSSTSAEAIVRSIYEGKTRLSKMIMLKEGGKWKLSRAARLPVVKTTTKTKT